MTCLEVMTLEVTMAVWSRCEGGEGYKIAHLNIRGSDESKTRCPRLASTAQCVFEGTLVVNMWTQLSIVIECVLVPPDLQPGSYSD